MCYPDQVLKINDVILLKYRFISLSFYCILLRKISFLVLCFMLTINKSVIYNSITHPSYSISKHFENKHAE